VGENSGISWTTHTFSPWVGCTKISPGCKYCYAEVYDRRTGGVPKRQRKDPGVSESRWGVNGRRVKTAVRNWRLPLKWNEEARSKPSPTYVFCSSLADVFEDRPELTPWREELFALIDATPYLTWQLLTKRPENIARMMPAYAFGPHRPNVWLGTSVEDQQRAEERLPYLVKQSAVVRFVSCEPLLEAVDLLKWLGALDWVIVGGESGEDARPFLFDWARDILNQFGRLGEAPRVFIKQMGSVPCMRREHLRDATRFEHRMQQDPRPGAPVGYVRAWFADDAGGDMDDWPPDLRVREFPVTP